MRAINLRDSLIVSCNKAVLKCLWYFVFQIHVIFNLYASIFLESCNIKLISWFTIYIKSWYLEFVLTRFNCTRLILILLVCESDLEKKMRLKIINKISVEKRIYIIIHFYFCWWRVITNICFEHDTQRNIEFNVYHKYGKMWGFFYNNISVEFDNALASNT